MNESAEFRIQRAIRRKLIRRMFFIGGTIIIIALIILLGIFLSKKLAIVPPGGTVIYEELGREHIGLNDKLPREYNSNPPSSGAHYPSPANWQVYDYEVNDKIFIHNLEHGGIWITYKPSISKDIIAELNGIVQEFKGSKLVMAPRSANDNDIAVVSWAHVYKFNVSGDHLSGQQKKDIENFYMALKNHAPEDVPDFMTGVDPKEVK